MELRQQAEFLNSGNDNNRLMTGLDSTAVDDWGASAAGKKKKKVRFTLDVACAGLLHLGHIQNPE